MNSFNEYDTPAVIKDWCSQQNPTINVRNLFRLAGFDWDAYTKELYHSKIGKEKAIKLSVAAAIKLSK